MRWIVRGRRAMYESDWLNVYIDDVEIPGGRRFEHHVLTMTRGSAGAVIVDDQDRVLLLWRHRFITDKWGWEVPAGWVDPGETPEQAVRREVEEETGWRVGHLESMADYNPLAGISSMEYRAFVAKPAEHVGRPPDPSESSKVEWIPLADVPKLARDGLIPDGPSLLMLSYYLGVYRAD
jgi:8-oxo-dGTP pyrophosphatase MutT (NUDIX family)